MIWFPVVVEVPVVPVVPVDETVVVVVVVAPVTPVVVAAWIVLVLAKNSDWFCQDPEYSLVSIPSGVLETI